MSLRRSLQVRAFLRRSPTAAVCFLAVLLLGAAAPTAATSGGQGPTAPDLAALDRFLSTHLPGTGLPGMAVAVTHGPDVPFVKGYGSAGGGEPVTPRTQFRIASLSKSFTATAVLQLVESGAVDLDAPVQHYLPEFVLADEGATRVTVRHLLNQTSGIADAGFPTVNDTGSADLRERVRSLDGGRLASRPGAAFQYSDLNYQILGRLVEVVGGVPFGDHLRTHVFDPLGMADTVATNTAADALRAAPRLARGHIVVFGVAVPRPEMDGFVGGSGGVVSSAHDMAHWLVTQNTGGTFDSRRILGSAETALAHTPPISVASTYGMGWQVSAAGDLPRRIEHTGVLSTFSADQVLLPDTGYGFALLYNGYSALTDTASIRAGVAALLTGTTPPTTSVPRLRILAALFTCLTLGTLALGARALLRLDRWRGRNRRRSYRRMLPGALWTLLPAAALALLPTAVLQMTGRVFTHAQLSRSMPDLVIWLGAAAATGAVVLAARLAASRHR
jgi:CubicO group peptidase (beta-lactamase class C family)